MALVSQARQGNSEDELDEMQREVDEIVREEKRLRCKSGVQTRLR